MLIITKVRSPILYVDTIDDCQHHINRLFKDWDEIQQLPMNNLNITVDFHYCEFLGHIGVAFLGGLARLIQLRGGHVNFCWNTLSKKIYVNLAQNGFLYDFGSSHNPWDGNSIPYRRDLRLEHTEITEYLRYRWLGKGWVNVSSQLQDAIICQVLEIYLNAFEHSNSQTGVFSCGQNYPQAGTLQLTVVDFGIGIPTSVRALPQNATISTTEALNWAFQSGNSTKNDTGVSRGAGLHLLKEFVKKNNGNLMIFSNDGCVIIGDNQVRQDKCTNFSGTLINITLKCDERYYCLASEVPRLIKGVF